MGFGGNPLTDGLVSVLLTFCTVNKLRFLGKRANTLKVFFRK